MTPPVSPTATAPHASPTWVLLDGAWHPASAPAFAPDDRGVLYGLGLFETLRVVRGRAPAWPLHRARLAAGLARLDLPWPSAVDQSLASLPALCARNGRGRGEAAARLTVTAGAVQGTPRTLLTVAPLSLRVRARRRGVDLMGRCAPRSVPELKSLAWWPHLRALEGRADQEEPLVLGAGGEVLETATANVFALVDGVIRTPPADGRLLAGVARAVVLAGCRAEGRVAIEAPLSLEDLRRAEAVWLTNALLPVAPVRSLDGIPLRRTGLHRWLARRYHAWVLAGLGGPL